MEAASMSEQNYLLLRRNILNLIKSNNTNRAINIRNKVNVTNEFSETKKNYNRVLERKDVPYQLKEKYNLEYLFLFEQNNLKVLPFDYDTKKSELYGDRLENILKYVIAKKEKTTAEAQSKLYSVNSSVIKEAIHYYNSKIDRLKQERIVNSKFKLYMDYIEQIDYSDYKQKLDLYPTDEVMEQLTIAIEELEQERTILVQTFKEVKFHVDEDDILELTDPDITQVLYSMYPNFKEKMLELNEIRRAEKLQTERNSEENKGRRQVA